jgi:hypothetical protein
MPSSAQALQSPAYYAPDDSNISHSKKDYLIVRIFYAALPFIALHKPFGKIITFVMDSIRTVISFNQLVEKKESKKLLETIVAISALAGTIFAHPLGLCISTLYNLGCDLTTVITICEKGETPEDSAKRELLEETGFTTKNLIFLGAIPPDTGISSAVIAIFMATVDNCQKTNLEESEAIESILTFTIEELKEGLKNGSILIKTQEKEKQVLLRDPFLAYALLQMEIRGFLRQNTRESPRILIVG